MRQLSFDLLAMLISLPQTVFQLCRPNRPDQRLYLINSTAKINGAFTDQAGLTA